MVWRHRHIFVSQRKFNTKVTTIVKSSTSSSISTPGATLVKVWAKRLVDIIILIYFIWSQMLLVLLYY